MIICRKCFRRHPDDVGAGPCECGADLRRDGMPVGESPLASREVEVIEDLEPIEPDLPAKITDPTVQAKAGPQPDVEAESSRAPGRTPSGTRTAPDRSGSDFDPPRPLPTDERPTDTVGEPAPRPPSKGELACPACAEPNHDTRR